MASVRTSSSEGVAPAPMARVLAPATAIEHPLGVRERQPAAAEQDREVVEHVGRLLGHALVRFLARGAGDLLGLLLHLGADRLRVGEQRRRVGAVRPLLRARRDRPLERRQRLVRRGRIELAPVEAGALSGVARRPGRLDEREQRVAVAVDSGSPGAPGVLPDVAPLCQSSWRERLKKCISPVSRVSRSDSAFM